jgi:general secretion pathway protein D
MTTRKSILTICLASLVAFAQAPQPAPQPPQQPPTQPQQPAAGGMGPLSLQNVSIVEVIDQLAKQLHINYILDPRVKGGVYLNTYGETRNLDPRNLLEMILHIGGFGMVQEGEIFRILPLSDLAKQPLRIQRELTANSIPEDDQIMLNLVFLKYVGVEELSAILLKFTEATITSYAPANLLFIMDTHRNMRHIMDLIAQFDSDMFVNQRVRLFELKSAKPSDVQKDLDNILKSISLDSKNSTVKFLAVDRISTLIAVAPNPGVFETIDEWIRKLDVPVTVVAGAVDIYVYHVRYGRADCLAMALNQLYGNPTNTSGLGAGYSGGAGAYGGGAYASPYAGTGGGYANGGAYGSPYSGGGGYGGTGGFGGTAGGAYGAANNFSSGFGGAGACGQGAGGGGMGFGTPAAFGGYSAQTPLMGTTTPANGAAQPAAAGTGGPAGGPAAEAPPRIVANQLDNSILIQADPQRYQSILKILKELDVPPRQILLEAKIYEVDLSSGLAAGLSWNLQGAGKVNGQITAPDSNGNLGIAATFSSGTLVDTARSLMATLSLSENVSKVHMVSEPSLIATDSIPATITVGTQVPVSTGSTTIPAGGNVAVTQSVSAEDTGVTLQVNARVSPSGIVTLIVNQQISSANASESSVSGSPAFDQQVVQTQITLMDGDTIAIGGTIKESVTDASSGIPGLNRIPWIGALFGSRSHTRARSELIMFMTPHVIYDETNLIEASDELKDRIKLLKRYVKY